MIKKLKIIFPLTIMVLLPLSVLSPRAYGADWNILEIFKFTNIKEILSSDKQDKDVSKEKREEEADKSREREVRENILVATPEVVKVGKKIKVRWKVDLDRKNKKGIIAMYRVGKDRPVDREVVEGEKGSVKFKAKKTGMYQFKYIKLKKEKILLVSNTVEVREHLERPKCGNGVCDSGETPESCPKDCALPPPDPPTLTLTASPTQISRGDISLLSWTSRHTTECQASGGWSGSKLLSGSEAINPMETKTYELTCHGPGGEISQSVTVTVSSLPPPSPPTLTLTAEPMQISAGGSSTLFWTSMNATRCQASGGWNGVKALTGNEVVHPTETKNYILTCTGLGGSVQRDVSVTVVGTPLSEPLCGNNILETSELCDRQDLNGQSCESLGYSGGTLLCNSRCTFDTALCVSSQPSLCGNGKIDPGEQCDRQNLSGQTCSSQGFSAGTLLCDAACQFDAVLCTNL